MNQWTLYSELQRMLHRWYMVLLLFTIGGALGWVVSNIIPVTYRVTNDLYVALDAHRTKEDLYVSSYSSFEYKLPDDYKNWQTSQLDVLILSDMYLRIVLEKLSALDPSWASVPPQELRKMLRLEWQNMGRWRLVVESKDPKKAEVVAKIWGETVVQYVQDAVTHSRNLLKDESELRSDSRKITQLIVRQSQLEEIHKTLLAWHTAFREKDAPLRLTDLEYWELQSWVGTASTLTPEWKKILDQTPALDAKTTEFFPWIDRISLNIQTELASIPAEIGKLQEHLASVTADYQFESPYSFALSANIDIREFEDTELTALPVRKHPTTAVVGGLLAVILWLGWILLQATRRSEG